MQPDSGRWGHTENLNEEVDSFQVCELVVVRVNTYAEEQSRVAAVHDLVVPELPTPSSARVRHITVLILLQTARTSTKFDWYFWSRGATSRCTSPLKRTYIPHHGVSDTFPRARAERETADLLVVIIRDVPFGEAGLALAVL